MATVFRVKRRRTEDPVEALRLSCKRKCISTSTTGSTDEPHSFTGSQQQTPVPENGLDYSNLKTNIGEKDTNLVTESTNTGAQIESILSFAGTISSKDDPISHHIKAAIRKKKLHKEMHPHNIDYRLGHKENLCSRKRESASEKSCANRYRVISTRRAIDLQQLDVDLKDQDKVSECKNTSTSELLSIKSNVQTLPNSTNILNENTASDKETPQAISLSTSNSSTVPEMSKNVIMNDKMFCVFDIENEAEDTVPSSEKNSNSLSDITVNNMRMVSSSILQAPLAESEYVYDLYYTHSDTNNIDLEAVLTVKSLCEEFVNEEDGVDRDFVYDDEDDSNDECNWRNDYPDEDPHFFENDDDLADCYYAEDMNYKDIVDDDELLSKWMGASCNVVSDDNDEDEYDEENDNSSDSSD